MSIMRSWARIALAAVSLGSAVLVGNATALAETRSLVRPEFENYLHWTSGRWSRRNPCDNAPVYNECDPGGSGSYSAPPGASHYSPPASGGGEMGSGSDINLQPSPLSDAMADDSSSSLSAGAAGDFGGNAVAVTDQSGLYLDNAIVGSFFRLRFDAGFDMNRPDRAEFFYAKCGCFRTAGLDPNAPGPDAVPKDIDYQEITAGMELAITRCFSTFIDVPTRFIDVENAFTSAGLGDITFGFKYALIAEQDRYLTAQLRVYAPTGDPEKGLGTDHWSLEPGLLYYQQFESGWVLLGELRDWIPIDGSSGAGTNFPNTPFAGNILRYGLGLGYSLLDPCMTDLQLIPLVEVAAWTVLGGQESIEQVGGLGLGAGGAERSADATIVNMKLGMRANYGCHSLGFGWGHALTGDRWYRDVGRLEYRFLF